MKRLTVSITIAAVLGLAAYTMAGAQGPAGERGFGRSGPGGPGGPGRAGMGMLRGLDLTDDQQAQIKAIHDAERDARQAPPADAQLHRQLQAEVFADSPDTQKLATLQEQILLAQAARLTTRLEVEQKVAQVLTAEQRVKVRAGLALGPGRRVRGQNDGGGRSPRPDR
jgi:Spy/CpxP family protein refolding chaperone